MKLGRNSLCPCGSGKKYKRCCYGKEQHVAGINTPRPQDFIENPDDDFLELQDMIIEMARNIHNNRLAKLAHIKRYKKIRKLHGEVCSSMIQAYYDGKYEPKMYSASDVDDLILSNQDGTFSLIESKFDLDSIIDEKAFYDILIYKTAPVINSITEYFIQNRRYRKPEKVDFLHSMLNSRLGLFEISGIDEDEGYAHLKDVFTGEIYKIIDVGLSGNLNDNHFYLYTRIITYYDISFNSGLNFVFPKTDNFIQNFIKQHKKDYNIDGEFPRFIRLYNYYSNNPNRIRTVAL